MIQTSIIILSYNTKDLLNSCLQSVYHHIYTKATEVIVVDNASTDGTVELLKKEQRLSVKEGVQLHLIENKENLGFAKGCNIGAKAAKGKYLLFLNSDAIVYEHSIEPLITYLENHPRVGIAGGLLVNADGTMQRSYGSFYTLFSVTKMLLAGDSGELFGQKTGRPKAVDWVSGGFMLIRKEIFDTINGFDEHFFMYMEDMELCYRVKKSGYDVFIIPEATVTHVGQGSSNRSFAIQHIYQGLRYFYRKHRSWLEYLVVNSLLLTKAIVLISLGTVIGNSYLKETYTKALKV